MLFIFVGLSREIAGLASRADSENENQEITPDTDTDSQEHMKMQMMPPQHQSSFKRAPIMGNRGLETRNSKRSNQRKTPMAPTTNAPTTPPVVGALEVQNVKRAINRYGTLPKGARIGAYLESLRQNGDASIVPQATTNSLPLQSVTNGNSVIMSSDAPILAPSGLSPRTTLKIQPQMIRSNSSGGVTMANSATASLTKLQRHRTTTDGTMMTTFSSFRGVSSSNSSSPKRNIQPCLADLEFPPPPIDLPPPPEDFEVTGNGISHHQTTSQYALDIPPPKLVQSGNNDVSNTAPSVEEASSRFGVSLRKREPSTDSCSSLGSPANDLGEIVGGKSPKLSPYNDVPKYSVDPASMLVNELAESMHYKSCDTKANELIRKPSNPLPIKPLIPPQPTADMNGIPFKAQLKKVEPKKLIKEPPKEEIPNIIDFKARLRKVDHNDDAVTSSINDEKNEIIKSTNNNNNKSDNNKMQTDNNNMDINIINKMKQSNGKGMEMKKTEIKIDVLMMDDKKRDSMEGNSLKTTTMLMMTGATIDGTMSEEDKRKSTGSISSLKKLWEAKEQQPGVGEQINQLSPKMATKNMGNRRDDHNEDNYTNNNNTSPSNNGHHPMEISVDLQQPKKPAVPAKPTKLTIYATPIQQQQQQLQHNKLIENNNHSSIGNSSSSVISGNGSSRENILELVQLVECNLKTPLNLITAIQWLQLSDKLNMIQSSCVTYAEVETIPPHQKFQLRAGATRIENLSNCLRTAGSKNVHENEKVVMEVGQSLKQLSNALHR